MIFWRGGLRPPVGQNNLGEITYLIKKGDPYGFGGAGYDRPYGKTTSMKSHTSSRGAILTVLEGRATTARTAKQPR